MLGRRSDLPLKGDASSRFLPLLVGLMVFLSVVATAGVFVLSETVGRWNRDVSGTLTVQIQPIGGESGEQMTDERVQTATEIIRQFKGVRAVRPLDKRRTLALLEPWLGNIDAVRDMPLPRLIDVEIDPDASIDLGEMASRLAQAATGASLDDHRIWLARLITLSRTIQMLAIAILLLIGVVTSATVVYATQTGMAVHYNVIEVLHLVGAHNDYIARQFADRAFSLGLGGGLLGLAFAVPALMAIGWAAQRVQGGFLPTMTLPITAYIVIGLLPLAAAALAMFAARLTVHRTLARMP